MSTHPDTHRKTIGYVLWIFGFTGSHRFYYGYPVMGTIYFFTLGLLFIGWIIDLFLIPEMESVNCLSWIKQAHTIFSSSGIHLEQ